LSLPDPRNKKSPADKTADDFFIEFYRIK